MFTSESVPAQGQLLTQGRGFCATPTADTEVVVILIQTQWSKCCGGKSQNNHQHGSRLLE